MRPMIIFAGGVAMGALIVLVTIVTRTERFEYCSLETCPSKDIVELTTTHRFEPVASVNGTWVFRRRI